jgi:hypothetical protein
MNKLSCDELLVIMQKMNEKHKKEINKLKEENECILDYCQAMYDHDINVNVIGNCVNIKKEGTRLDGKRCRWVCNKALWWGLAEGQGETATNNYSKCDTCTKSFCDYCVSYNDALHEIPGGKECSTCREQRIEIDFALLGKKYVHDMGDESSDESSE